MEKQQRSEVFFLLPSESYNVFVCCFSFTVFKTESSKLFARAAPEDTLQGGYLHLHEPSWDAARRRQAYGEQVQTDKEPATLPEPAKTAHAPKRKRVRVLRKEYGT